MALIKCSECGKKVSDTTESCIHCGNPLNEIYHDNETYTDIPTMSLEDYKKWKKLAIIITISSVIFVMLLFVIIKVIFKI